MKKLNSENLNTSVYYDSSWDSRLKEDGLDHSEAQRMNALLRNWQGGKFLDLGCGAAPFSLEACKTLNSEIWALDFSPNLIERLKTGRFKKDDTKEEDYSKINLIVGNLKELPFRDEYFDYIIAGEVLEHTEVPEDFLKETFRVLKKGGTLVLSTPFEEGYSREPCSLEHLWGFDEEDVRDLLKQFGETEVVKINIFILGYCKKI